MAYCGVANRVPFQGFFYNSLPVIQGKFTLRQALEEHLVTKINDATILDTEIDTLEHVPCSALYVLAFGDHELFVVRGTNRIDELFIHDKQIPQKSVVPQKLLDGFVRVMARFATRTELLRSQLLQAPRNCTGYFIGRHWRAIQSEIK